MSEWKKCRLGDLTSLVCSGGTPRTTNSDYYEGGSIPWLNTKEVSFCRINSTEKCITESGLSSSSAKWVPANTVVVAMYGATAGQVAITRIPLTTNQACCNLVIDEGKANADFVYYSLVNSYRELSLLANGAAQQNLNAQVIKEFVVQLPDLPTQRRIAAVLGALDDKIENNRKICENLEAQAQALFKSWFVDFEPWGGKMPEGWKKGKLRDIAGYDNRRIAASNLTVETYFSTENMLTDRGGVVAAASIPQSGEVPLCEEGSVLVSNIRPYFKKIYRATETAGHSADVLCFEAKDSSWQWYLYRLLWDDAFFAYVMSGVKGCKMPRGDKEQILDYGCVIPGADNVAEFNAVVEPMCQRITHCNKESRALAEMRDALLPQLMSGRLRVDATACQGEIDVGKVEI